MALSEPVLKHALEWIEESEGTPYDIVLYLQVTDPFRQPGILSEVVSCLISNPNLDTVFAAKPDKKNYWIEETDGTFSPLGSQNHLPRQIKRQIFREDTGIACAIRAHVVRQGKRIGAQASIVPHYSVGDFIDIHEQVDLDLANLLISQLNVYPNHAKEHA